MIDLTGITHHPAIEEIVEVLCNKTQNTNKGFFRAELAFFLSKLASSMRATIVTKDRGDIPVNMYVIALAPSGFGKGHSVAIVEGDFLSKFKKRFMEETFPTVANNNLWVIARDRALRKGTQEDIEYESVSNEFNRAGPIPYTFDSGTKEGVRQIRHKLLLSDCGAINLQIDEIGSNLINSSDLLNIFLELYDQGSIKQKLIKNTVDNQRNEEIEGKTPTNLLLFGTPSKLLDGGQSEDQFYSFLDVGYARRCLFGWGQHEQKAHNTQNATQIYNNLIHPNNSIIIDKWSNHFYNLADPALFNWRMAVEDSVGILLWEYKIACEKAADAMKEHEEIRKAEMNHRYFKVLKLAGAFAFIDQSMEVEEIHIKQAVLLVEEGGAAFQTILTREKTYVKLAKYIADMGSELTHADLMEALPFYKSSNSARNELITLATAWGYKKHIIIKKSFDNGIELFTGEKLKESNLDEVVVSYSEHWAYNFLGEKVPFNMLHNMTQAKDIHWCNHHFKNGHRVRENIIAGFNIIVIDVDEGCSLALAHSLLSDLEFMTYTTKRHQTEGSDRFRIIIPINYYLKLDHIDYKEFMNNILNWLPFASDTSSNQIEKKWESFEGGTYHYNHTGNLLDVLPFIPRTSKNEQYRQGNQKLQSLDNLERWFAQRIASGNRNNQMIKYALALADSGMTLLEVQEQVYAFNQKLHDPMDVTEIDKTILVTVAKHFVNTHTTGEEDE